MASVNIIGYPDNSRPTPAILRRRRARQVRVPCPQDLNSWHFSHHARTRVDSRGFAPHEVLLAVTHPEITVTAFNYGPGRVRYVRGDLVVVACPEASEIVTVLLHSQDEWDDNDARTVNGQ
jgi:hypothetical protein